MKIGMYVHHAQVGGAEDMVIDEIKYADRDKFRYVFFTEIDSGWGPCLDEIQALGVEVVRREHRPDVFQTAYQDYGIKLLHVYSCGDIQPGFRAALNAKIPVVDTQACVSYSAGYEENPDLVHPTYLCYEHHAHGGGGKPQFKVIVGGVDLSRLAGPLKPDANSLEIGWYGRFDCFKCPFTFVEIAKAVKSRVPASRFVMWGDGPDRGRSQFLAKEAGVDIRFPGFTRDKATAFASMDVFCFPTWQEAFGRVMVEAMACGIPIVTADYPVCREICGQAALYTPNERQDPMSHANAEVYAQCIIDILNEAELQESMRLEGIRRANTYYDARRMAKEYGELYEQIAGGQK